MGRGDEEITRQKEARDGMAEMMKIKQRMKGLGYALLGLGLYFLVEAFWSLQNNGDIGQAKQRLIISLSLNIAGLIFLCVFDRAW